MARMFGTDGVRGVAGGADQRYFPGGFNLTIRWAMGHGNGNVYVVSSFLLSPPLHGLLLSSLVRVSTLHDKLPEFQ